MGPKRGIIDNVSDGYSLADFLVEKLGVSRVDELDIATGYLNVSGYALIRDRLRKAVESGSFRLRLLYGQETLPSGQDTDELSLKTELENAPVSASYAALVDDFISFLRRSNVFVRRNRERFSHAKCYVFGSDDAAVVGSSNFTAKGLKGNVELNAVLYQPEMVRAVREWFDRRWADAEDSKGELIELLQESKFGLPLDPYTFYMKFLYEYYKPRLKDFESETHHVLELANFQKEAVRSALRILRRFGGVMIADSTGLGKTYVATEILRQLVSVEGKKALVIAPAQVLETIWEVILFDQSIKTKNVTLESTGTRSFVPEEYLDYDVVLIDESHNYRNANTNRFSKIMRVLSGGKRKLVILMSATPINNSLFDLYNQLSLITAGDDTYFASLGIRDMREVFLKAERKGLEHGLLDILRLLDELVVRRTRRFIKENYPDAEINGRPVTFPERTLVKVEYSLTSIFGSQIYEQVVKTIENLHMVPYRLDYYRRTVSVEDKDKAEQLAVLQQFNLLKRFESSVEAIRQSVKRLTRFYEYFEKTLRSDKILTPDDFRDLLSTLEDSEAEDEEKFYEKAMSLKLLRIGADYDKQSMLADLREDLGKLRYLSQSLEAIKPWADRKLIALKEQLAKDRVFDVDGKKAVVFTQFIDTAKYVYGQLEKDLVDKRVALITGETDPQTRAKIMRLFAPKSNPSSSPVDAEYDILVSTDVVAEGQNLQDCNYVVNYDLPWNPMKIVQRVGRVDRLGSEWSNVKSVVFIPDKELNDFLRLTERLEERIRKARETVGTEATILGEAANPKTFNAVVSRIVREDRKLIDDLEAQGEALPEGLTGFQKILEFIRKQGSAKLEAIPLGKRSGKRSDVDGIIIFYRERGNPDGIHIVFYNHNTAQIERYNEIAWTMNHIECANGEERVLPMKGDSGFRLFEDIDKKAREYIIPYVNTPYSVSQTQRIKPKYQNELLRLIVDAVKEGKVDHEAASKAYKILSSRSLMAYDDEFENIFRDYQRHQNLDQMFVQLNTLIERSRIRPLERPIAKSLKPDDLELVCYIYLSKEGSSWSRLS